MTVPNSKPRHWLASNPFDSNLSTGCYLRIELQPWMPPEKELAMSAIGPEPDARSERGCLARSDQGRHLSSLKSASRLTKGLTAAGVGIASTATIGLYWN